MEASQMPVKLDSYVVYPFAFQTYVSGVQSEKTYCCYVYDSEQREVVFNQDFDTLDEAQSVCTALWYVAKRVGEVA